MKRMSTTSTAIAVNILADALCGGEAPALVRCVCTYCCWELDPRGEMPVRLAPDHGECGECGDPERERLGGLVYLVVPREGLRARG